MLMSADLALILQLTRVDLVLQLLRGPRDQNARALLSSVYIAMCFHCFLFLAHREARMSTVFVYANVTVMIEMGSIRSA